MTGGVGGCAARCSNGNRGPDNQPGRFRSHGVRLGCVRVSTNFWCGRITKLSRVAGLDVRADDQSSWQPSGAMIQLQPRAGQQIREVSEPRCPAGLRAGLNQLLVRPHHQIVAGSRGWMSGPMSGGVGGWRRDDPTATAGRTTNPGGFGATVSGWAACGSQPTFGAAASPNCRGLAGLDVDRVQRSRPQARSVPSRCPNFRGWPDGPTLKDTGFAHTAGVRQKPDGKYRANHDFSLAPAAAK